VNPGATSIVTLLDPSIEEEFQGATWTRLLLDLYLFTPSTTVSAGLSIWGAGILQEDLTAVLVPVVPSPLLGTEADWLYSERGILVMYLNDNQNQQNTNLSSVHIQRDLRGQRKVNQAERIVFAFEVDGFGTDIVYFLNTRTLYRLS